MKGEGSYKIPGGKLVRARVEFSGVIERVVLTGDFFLHPEEGIGLLEEALKGWDIQVGEETLVGALRRVAEAEGLVLVGITPKGIVKAVQEALR